MNAAEAKLQANCYIEFCSRYPQEREYLWMNFNNPPNAIAGAKLKSMGLTPGISDMTFLARGNFSYFIEFKVEPNKQSPKQIEFQKAVEERGAIYAVVYNREEFFFWVHIAMLHNIISADLATERQANSDERRLSYKYVDQLHHILFQENGEKIGPDLFKYFSNLEIIQS
jgi:hypothetical protein